MFSVNICHFSLLIVLLVWYSMLCIVYILCKIYSDYIIFYFIFLRKIEMALSLSRSLKH